MFSAMLIGIGLTLSIVNVISRVTRDGFAIARSTIDSFGIWDELCGAFGFVGAAIGE